MKNEYKINIRKKKIILVSLLVLTLVSLASSVKAFAVGSPCDTKNCYWEGRPLVLSAGESRDLIFVLQNNVGGNDVRLNAEVVNGSEVASFTDLSLEYFLPFGTENVNARMRITIPTNAETGKEYAVSVKFKEIALTEGDTVQFGGVIGKSFSVLVGEGEEPLQEIAQEETEEGKASGALIVTFMILIIVLIAVGIVIVLIQKGKIKRSEINKPIRHQEDT